MHLHHLEQKLSTMWSNRVFFCPVFWTNAMQWCDFFYSCNCVNCCLSWCGISASQDEGGQSNPLLQINSLLGWEITVRTCCLLKIKESRYFHMMELFERYRIFVELYGIWYTQNNLIFCKSICFLHFCLHCEMQRCTTSEGCILPFRPAVSFSLGLAQTKLTLLPFFQYNCCKRKQ